MTAGEQCALLYGGRALHGEKPSAMDRAALLQAWRKTWRVVIKDLTPIQRKAL